MSGRLSRAHTLPLRGRAVHIHSRVIGVPGWRRATIHTFVSRRTNVRGRTLRHMGSRCQRASGQFSSNTLTTQFDALVDALLNLLGHIAATGLLLLLSTGHLLTLLTTRHDLLAIQSDGARD